MKYIVYMTVNSVNRKIYIGVHKISNEVFDGYIGCGLFKHSKKLIQEASTPFRAAVKKYGYDKFIRITLGTYSTAEHAYEEEARLVTQDFVLRKDTYNIALGGYYSKNYSKKILQYSLDGKFIQEWDSLNDIATAFNKKSTNALSKHLGRRSDTYIGFQWLYHHEDFPKVINPVLKVLAIPVYQYDIDGNYINTFKSAHDAGKQLDINTSAIKNSLRTQNLYKGFQWRVFNSDVPESISKYIDKNIILQIDIKSNNIVEEWPSKQEAEILFKNLSRALRGKSKTAHGYRWVHKYNYVE